MPLLVSLWMAVVATSTLCWAMWRQSRPVTCVRVQSKLPHCDDPYPDKLTFTVANTGTTAITISGLALTVHPSAIWKFTGIPQVWHNMVRPVYSEVSLPRLLAVGEEWTATVTLDDKLISHAEKGNLRYQATVSYRRRPLSGKIRRRGLLDLLFA